MRLGQEVKTPKKNGSFTENPYFCYELNIEVMARLTLQVDMPSL